MTSDSPVAYEDVTEHFKYGSIGSEPGGSLLRLVGGSLPPYWIFRALPSICPEKLPGGFASVGLLTEPGKDLPIGVSHRRRFGVDQVGFNCALCHTGTVRDAPGAPPRIMLGMPAHQLDLQRLVTFVLECSLDSRLTRENVLARVEEMGGGGPSLFERAAPAFCPAGSAERLRCSSSDRGSLQCSAIEYRPGDAVEWTRSTRTSPFNSTGRSIGFRRPN